MTTPTQKIQMKALEKAINQRYKVSLSSRISYFFENIMMFFLACLAIIFQPLNLFIGGQTAQKIKAELKGIQETNSKWKEAVQKLKEETIVLIKKHAEFGCDKMEQEVCQKLLWEVDTKFKLFLEELTNQSQNKQGITTLREDTSAEFLPSRNAPLISSDCTQSKQKGEKK